MSYKKKRCLKSSIICKNKKAYYNYFIEEVFQSGLVLMGWEVKSIRLGQVNIIESYINNDNLNEMYLYNSIVQPLHTSSNYVSCDSSRKRKLLLHKNEIQYLCNKKNKIGSTLVALSLFWEKSWCKLNFGLAKGKTKIDKRASEKQNEWKKEKLKILKKVKFQN
ncbi:SsrA-binding protein SmpB [Buchnera aphidicola]|jgi:SsrA-binding protein|uniref:SsrA-binding protein n=1 Tax=Buchnera aphidicola subsp. Schizaphis graminum (strain Sg) TaxID=198804 RepID=SSRP_BUCAP|nr:SsrA-binding protein SmpB [Buchnera aphidicola]Q8K9R5.1 RecName: Full=SsrA-binding protein; AltName: Full=Small protein B [Buchnera aphidicola str. Sg (Schizaphis graminum)]AAM67804.1 small protein B [Buchnera aphidicola str. Sg (Schizaphis graminum)]AWI49698.1 SsrA-binding protein [Buchnera aphidicola (Schizaphis graminum)]